MELIQLSTDTGGQFQDETHPKQHVNLMLLECENGKNIKKEHSSQPGPAVPEKTLIGHLFQGLQFVFIKREFPLFLPDIELL